MRFASLLIPLALASYTVCDGNGFIDHQDTRSAGGSGHNESGGTDNAKSGTADHNTARPGLNPGSLPFTRHVIAPSSGGKDKRYGKAIGDLSGDGMPDILLSSAAGAGMRWYEYPRWETRVLIASGSWSEDVQIADMDGDDDFDVINSNRNGVHWYENPLPDGDPRLGRWDEHHVGGDGSNVHDLEVGDLNGDGRCDIAVRYEMQTNRSVMVFLQGSETASWLAYAVNDTDLKGEGLALGDMDGDGDLDVVLQRTWWENDGTGTSWTGRAYAIGLTAQMIVRVADLDGDGRNDIIVSPQSSGASEFAWFSATDPLGPWTKHVIRSGITRMHGLAVADFNGDGHLDLHTSLRHDLAGTSDNVAIWLSNGAVVPTFTEQILATSGSHFSKVGDIGLDGDMDIIGANWGGDDPLELWENLSVVGGLAIDVWYGDEQHFGRLGVPQKWVNILGRVRSVDELAALQYTLNGSSPKNLSVGADGFRLARPGDFNVDLEYDELREGKSLVTLVATDAAGRRVERDVTVHCYKDRAWPLPYSVDWTKVQAISDVVQIVDGNWKLETDGVRTVEPYYDRILAFGDRTWTDYTVTVAVTFHGYSAPRKGPPTYGVSHAAIAARFPGHFADSRQPHVQWYPLGAVAEFRLAENLAESSWRIFRDGEPGKQPLALNASEHQQVELGVRYMLKLRVDSQPGPGSRYRVKSWKHGEIEPVAWAMDTTKTGSIVTAGGALIAAHNTDVTFGSLSVTPNATDE